MTAGVTAGAGGRAAVRAAADRLLDELAADPRYRRTSHLHVRVGGAVVVDEHLLGPLSNDVFSVTKSVVATVLGVVAARGLLPDLDEPVADVLPALRGTPAARHTWRHLLTMTRGSVVDGPWEIDAVAALPGGQVAHLAQAPQLHEPGTRFVYDNGAPHLLSAAAAHLVGEPLAAFADRELFAPLGFADHHWPSDPDGVSTGSDGLRVRAADLAALGQLWLDHGRLHGRTVVDRAFLAQMTSTQAAGGPPEGVPYGFLTWVPDAMVLAGGWAGQHLLVVPAAAAVIVTTADAGFDPGPPPTDAMPADWAPALDLVRRHVLPVLRPTGG